MALYEDIAELLHQGRKLEAIKVYREVEGVSLAEAKDGVEDIERRVIKQGLNQFSSHTATQKSKNVKSADVKETFKHNVQDNSRVIVTMLIILVGLGAFIVAYLLGLT